MTTTIAGPAVPEGVVQVAEVAETTITDVHAAPPTVIPIAPVKLVPVIVTRVPPAVLPNVGETEEAVGAGIGTPTVMVSAPQVYVTPPGVIPRLDNCLLPRVIVELMLPP